MDHLKCWDNVALCVISMLGMGNMYAEKVDADRTCVTIHGYSFEGRDANRPLCDEVVRFCVPRLPRGMELEIVIVCPDGLLEMRSPE